MCDKTKCRVCAGLEDAALITRALRKGVRQALRQHKLLGQSVVVMRDGEIVWLRPEEIPVEDAEADETA